MTELMASEEQNKQTSNTKLLYLYDSYNFEAESKLLGSGTDAKGSYLVLEETIFYPQGGGQPSDVGTIEIDCQILTVYFVSFNNGLVQHYVKENLDSFKCGSSCRMIIDKERRLKNAISHTGGHLLAAIVEKLAPELIGIKGHHFPEGSYVEFKGKLTSLNANELTEKVVQLANENMKENRMVTAREVDSFELKNMRNIELQLQEGKKARVVQIEGYEPVPCGGTHLKNLDEIKNFNIRKIQFPKENTKIGYACS